MRARAYAERLKAKAATKDGVVKRWSSRSLALLLLILRGSFGLER